MDAHSAKTRQQLLQEHERLDSLLLQLANAVDTADAATLQKLWTDFETNLARHLDAEERSIFPLLEAAHSEAVQQALREHQQIRNLVSELGVQTDLHMLRKTIADRLIDLLRSHADRENSTIYRWLSEG